MRHIDILSIKLSQIQMFLAVADTESITSASQYLHVSQPTLSKNIASFEQELGLLLFNRDKGKLRLTAAGKILQKELMAATNLIESAIENAHNVQKGLDRPILIGMPDGVDPAKYLIPSIENFKSEDSGFKYNIECFPFQDLSIKLVNKELDVVFTAAFEEISFQEMNIDYKIIAKFPLSAYVTRNNKIAEKAIIDVKDLRDQRFIIFSPRIMPNYFNAVIAPICEKNSFTPAVSYYAASAGAVAINIINDDEVSIADCCLKADPYLNLKMIPIRDTSGGIIMAWQKDGNPAAIRFVNSTISYWNKHKIEN